MYQQPLRRQSGLVDTVSGGFPWATSENGTPLAPAKWAVLANSVGGLFAVTQR